MNIDTTEKRRIHFLTEVEDHGAAYSCNRCGHATATKVEMYEHRKGFISQCLRKRVIDRLTGKKNET